MQFTVVNFHADEIYKHHHVLICRYVLISSLYCATPFLDIRIIELCVANLDWLHLDDVIKWKHFLRYWPFVRGIHRWPVNSPHKGQWRGTLMCSLICAWLNGWVNNGEAGDLRPHCALYDVTVMLGCRPYHFSTLQWRARVMALQIMDNATVC